MLLLAFVGLASCEQSDPKADFTLQLSVDNSQIYANGAQTATFTVVKRDAASGSVDVTSECTIYNVTTGKALDGNSFATTEHGSYTFCAKLDGVESNDVMVVAKQVTDDTRIVTLSASAQELEVGQSVVFSVDCNGQDVTPLCYFYNADGDVKLSSEEFAADEAGSYSFYAMYEDTKSNLVTVVFVQAAPGELELSASATTIDADGKSQVTFTVKQDGEDVTASCDIYNAAGDVKLATNSFATTEAGSYSFYAMKDGAKSNVVAVTAVAVEPEAPIELSASTLQIKANGVDFAVFTVKQEGNDVTSESVIYANDGVVQGSRFATLTPGSYTIYAEKNGVRSNEVVLTAEAVTESGKTIVFAEGVTLTSGWYDVNKYGQGDNGDINMCWAAASSNMIQWFQDRYVAAGNTLPAKAVSGPGRNAIGDKAHTYELAVMELFWSEWNNDRGGHMEQAIPWYFEGVLNGGEYASSGSQAVPLTDGGYWKDIWSDVTPYMYCDYDSTVGYTTCFNNYYLWGNGTDYLGVERLKIVSDIIVDAFEHGMAGLTISLAANISSVHHATTLWGYEIDNATGLVTRLWITDSDDLTSQPKQPLLNEYSVSIADGQSHVKLTGDTRYGSCYIVSLHPLSGYKR